MTLGELAKFQRCVKSNISYITRTMERDGLVHLAASASDQRARVLSPSKLGTRSTSGSSTIAGRVTAGTRTIHAFGGRRARRATETPS
jgi:hypothetical protein